MLIDLPSFAVGGLVGAFVAVVVWAVSRRLRHRRPTGAENPAVERAAAVAGPGMAPKSVPVTGPDGRSDASATPVSSEQVHLSERILVLLAREGRLTEESPARPIRTQGGLVVALGSNQSAVSKILRRLVAAELLTEERRHVRGRDRRLKVYALTRRGELLAREVARRRNWSLLPDFPGPRNEVGIRPLPGSGKERLLGQRSESLVERSDQSPLE